MDLADWKNVENATENQIRDAKMQLELGEIILQVAHTHIKRLKGLTNGEEDAKEKARVKKERERTT